MSTHNDIIQLAQMLETEWKGGTIDRKHVRDLAERLLPHHPELRNTLSSVRNRMSQI
jgi:hypothetical protein